MTNFLLTLCAISFLASLYNLASVNRPGFYPPKKVLKKRASQLFGAGVLLLLLALVTNSLTT